MGGVQFLAQADCSFQTLLQLSSETHPVSYPKITLDSYPNSKFFGSHSIEAENMWSLNVMPVETIYILYEDPEWLNQ